MQHRSVAADSSPCAVWQISCGTAEIENLQRSMASLTEQQDALDLNTAKGKTDYAWFEDMISASRPYPKPYPYPGPNPKVLSLDESIR